MASVVERSSRSPGDAPEAPELGSGHPRWRLFGLSFLMLFTELALIRWTGSNNIHLAYLTNFVLLASFLGIGVGFLRARSGPDGFPWMPLILLLLVAFVLAFPVSIGSLAHPAPVGRWGWAPLPSWLSLSVTFVLAALVMATIAQAVARSFVQFRPLEAYRLDILGSIAGIAAFSALALFHLPPVAWGAGVAIVFVALVRRRTRWWQVVAIVAVVGLLAVESSAKNDRWSPYYKVTAVNLPGQQGFKVSANNIPHQTAYPISVLHRMQRFYFFPYRHVPSGALNDVLIVGAGNGNDVAVALSRGAKHVDAVEIDPVIQALGRARHPNHPYKDPRVTVHINDGRAYLEGTSKKYDLIMFALPDSLTLLPGQSNLRLENYLFTVEAMRSARDHLKPGGSFSMYNYYEPFLLDRYAVTLKNVYGARPCVELAASLAQRRQAVLSVANQPVPRCAHRWHGRNVEPVTDNRPYPYLTSNAIPGFYLRTLGLVLLASLIAVRLFGGPFRGMARYVDLMFMGAAFLLLETKNIVQFALLFGTTWVVNSLVFAGILLSVFAAVEVARRVRLPRPVFLYGALFAALATAWLIPPDNLLGFGTVPRFLLATLIAFAPIFLANLIFAQRFKDVASSTTAFGANLLGAMIGGVLEYLALITGYRFLLVVVAGLYALALLTGRRLAPAR